MQQALLAIAQGHRQGVSACAHAHTCARTHTCTHIHAHAGDRHLTPWLKVMGKGAPTAPLVEVVLRRSGQELLGVVATKRKEKTQGLGRKEEERLCMLSPSLMSPWLQPRATMACRACNSGLLAAGVAVGRVTL
eukprot:scaffold59288_cov23-Tisochrysis_lutea.AAC.1